MKYGFVTCVQLGLSCMQEIYRVNGQLDLAITLPDDRARTKSGRVYLDEFCASHGIPLLKVDNINDGEAIDAITRKSIDWLFIIGWSQIAGPNVLDAPEKGALGMHPTLLPRGRGRAAIPWAILKGLKVTGVTLFKLDEGVDTGPILAQERIVLEPRETATILYEKVNAAHASLIRNTWPALEHDEIELREQDDRDATTWPRRGPEDGRITLSMTVGEADALVRAVTHPYPGAFVDLDGQRLRIWKGQPADDVGDGDVGVAIDLADGRFVAQDYEWEDL